MKAQEVKTGFIRAYTSLSVKLSQFPFVKKQIVSVQQELM